VVATEIYLLRLMPIPYLFAHTGTLRESISVSRRITHHRGNELVSLYLDHTIWLFFIPLIIPWFFISAIFQTARASAIRAFLREIPPKNNACVLQRRKKYGRIGR